MRSVGSRGCMPKVSSAGLVPRLRWSAVRRANVGRQMRQPIRPMLVSHGVQGSFQSHFDVFVLPFNVSQRRRVIRRGIRHLDAHCFVDIPPQLRHKGVAIIRPQLCWEAKTLNPAMNKSSAALLCCGLGEGYRLYPATGAVNDGK